MSSDPTAPASPGNPAWSSRSRPVMVGGGKRITAEDLARMFKALTGKDSTPEQLAKSQKKLDEAYARLAASQQDAPEPAQPIARGVIPPTWPFTYHEHENSYFRLSDFHVPAVRRGGKWVPYRGLYLPCDIRRYGAVVSQDEAEFSGR